MKIRSGFAKNLNELLNKKACVSALIVISGVLSAMTLIFDLISAMIFFSMIPLVLVLMKKSEDTGESGKIFCGYGVGFLWSFSFYIVIYHWFWYLWPMDFMGVEKPMALLITLFCWIGLSLFQALGTAFVGPLFCAACRKKGREKLAPLVFACAWTLLEFVQSLTWMGVPWARLALSQTSFPAAVQSASLFGSLGIGMLIAFVNGLLAVAVKHFALEGKRSKTALRFAAFALAAVMLNLGYGMTAIGLHDEKKGEAVSVTLIQGNISSNDKWADDSLSASITVYEELTLEADEKEHADIVLWPETVIVTSVKESRIYRERIRTLAEKTGSVIFVGAFDSYESEDGEVYEEYNAVIGFFPDGSIEEGSYKKQHLVPFGEYMPMRNILETLFPFMTELNMLESDLSAGESSEIIDTEFGKIGRLICFDSIYPILARKSVADGAEYILLSTNDSWYRDSASAYQHNAHAVLRAVENRRYIARAASTGISSVITSEGKVLELLDPLVEGYVTAAVYTSNTKTLYSCIGDSVTVVPSATVLVFLIVSDLVPRRKSKKISPVTEK